MLKNNKGSIHFWKRKQTRRKYRCRASGLRVT